VGQDQDPISNCTWRQDEHNQAKANSFGSSPPEDCRGATCALGEGQVEAKAIEIRKGLDTGPHCDLYSQNIKMPEILIG
jgi:hypothetical protein